MSAVTPSLTPEPPTDTIAQRNEPIVKGRRQYTVQRILEVLEALRSVYNNNRSLCSRETGIPRTLIVDWIKESEKFSLVSSDRHQTVKRVRHMLDQEAKRAKYPDMEGELWDWIKGQRMEGLAVDTALVMEQGRKIFERKKEEDPVYADQTFIASKGWAAKFMNRYNLVQRAFTSVGQKVPDHALFLSQEMFETFDKQSAGVKVMDIGNMDETPVYFDMPNTRTIDARGVQRVKCKTTGHEKLRFTVVLTIMSDGKKLAPMVIFKNLVKAPKGNFPKDMVITATKGGSMTADLMQVYREKIWGKRGRSLFRPPSLLVMDSHRSHMVEQVVQAFKKESRTECVFVPGGMTPILQPLDVYVNKSFKSLLKAQWREWMRSGEEKKTKSGKRQRASYEQVCAWVQSAWDDVKVEVISNSFAGCGLVSPRDQEAFHSALKTLVEEKTVTEEQSGITDDEEDIIEEADVVQDE